MRALVPFVPLLLAPWLATQEPITAPEVLRTRAVWFVQNDNPVGAEVGLRWQPLPWNEAAAKAWDGAAGTRVSMGHEVWAALETFTALRFGDVAVPAGDYYAMLEKDVGGWRLGLFDADKVRALQITPGGGKQPFVAAIPLRATKAAGDGAKVLGAAWEPAAGGGTVTLVLRFGPHELRADAKVAGSEGASPLALPDARAASRVWFSKGKGKPSGERHAFAVVDHGPVAWSAELAQQAAALATGQRWRLGKDWATTLDTNAALQLGAAKLAPGSWHLTLEKAADGWQLVVSAAAADHRGKLDGFAAQHVVPVAKAALQRAALSPPADALRVAFVATGKTLELAIEFGPERLTVPVAGAP